MNYYPHHIGDFNNATRHLTRMERSVYRDLIDLYYDTERELTDDFNALCRLIIARSDEERAAVEQVLNEFFTQNEQGWFHERCNNEIQKYKSTTAAKSAAGKASAARRAQKPPQKTNINTTHDGDSLNEERTDVEQVLNGCATNQEPITNNQEPIKEKVKKENPDASPPAQPAPKKSTGAKATGTRLPENFKVPDDWIDWATDERPDIPPPEMRTVAESFVDYWAAKAGAAARKVDWLATWRNWVRSQKRYSSPPPRQQKFDPTAYVNRNRVPSHDIIDI